MRRSSLPVWSVADETTPVPACRPNITFRIHRQPVGHSLAFGRPDEYPLVSDASRIPDRSRKGKFRASANQYNTFAYGQV